MKYTVWFEFYGGEEDAREAEAESPLAAAERAAREFDSHGDMRLARDGGATAWVRDPDGIVTKWDIDIETEVNYYARELKVKGS